MNERRPSSCLSPLMRCVAVAVCALAMSGPAWADGARDLRAVDRALAGTGFGADSLLRRHARETSQGGPFVPESSQPEPRRWHRLQRALMVLPLAAPLAEYQVTSGYGRRRDPINHRRAMHTGVDLRAPVRAPVTATAPGRVAFVGRRGSYGFMVEIDHGLGVHTRYAHLARITVRVGQQVAAGTRVGLLGNSGRSTGPHLHYEVLVDGRSRDPHPFLKAGLKLSDSVLPSTDRHDRGSRAVPSTRGCPCP